MTITQDGLNAYMHGRDAGNPGDMGYKSNDDMSDIARATSAITRYNQGTKSKFAWITAMFSLMNCGVTPLTAYRWLKSA